VIIDGIVYYAPITLNNNNSPVLLEAKFTVTVPVVAVGFNK